MVQKTRKKKENFNLPKRERGFACMDLVEGWIGRILCIISMQTKLLFKGSSENWQTKLHFLQVFILKFCSPDKKREIIFKQAKIKPVFLDEVVFANINSSNFYTSRTVTSIFLS